jgi:hypothetical protein
VPAALHLARVVLAFHVLLHRVGDAEEEVVPHPEGAWVHPQPGEGDPTPPRGRQIGARDVGGLPGLELVGKRRAERVVGAQRALEVGMIVVGFLLARQEGALEEVDRVAAGLDGGVATFSPC